MKKEKNMKKVLSIVVAISMLTTGVLIAATFRSPIVMKAEAVPPIPENATSLRVYGEEDAIYPTHAYMDWANPSLVEDFIYPNYQLPFDPGVSSKDCLTFNPAYIDLMYHGKPIRVDGGDSSEKVYLRLFYEPGYNHTIDRKMDENSTAVLKPTDTWNAVVTETTYFLVTADNEPIAGSPPGEMTHFMLPYASMDPDIPGMDTADVLDLVRIGDGGTTCYPKTDGNITVEMIYEDIPLDTELTFMDHNITLVSVTGDPGKEEVKVSVKYVGNMMESHSDPRSHYLDQRHTYWFSRSNDKKMGGWATSDAAYRWYVNITWYANGLCDLKIGRWLEAGETFYVNGMRYDMPAICVENHTAPAKFKYIVFQSPIPKCYTEMWFNNPNKDVEDWSHVTSQWLANLLPEVNVWLLPPFNEEHRMIDDIGLIKNETRYWQDDEDPPYDWEIPPSGILLKDMKDSLKFYYIEETTEERFNTSLAERLNQTAEHEEEWDWWSVYTKPINYTAFVLPNQETTDDEYDEHDPDLEKWLDKHDYEYPFTTADGFEYLLVSSWIAPNSNSTEERWNISKSSYDAHDILDLSDWIADWVSSVTGAPDNRREDFKNCSRVAFEFDAYNGTGIYINGEAALPEEQPWDVNGDNVVDFWDVIEVADHWGETGTPGWIPADVNKDGVVDFWDVILIADHWGETYP